MYGIHFAFDEASAGKGCFDIGHNLRGHEEGLAGATRRIVSLRKQHSGLWFTLYRKEIDKRKGIGEPSFKITYPPLEKG